MASRVRALEKTGAEPFLKWAGGKRKLVKQIAEALPAGSRLVEPFVGSGAVFMGLDYPAYVLADANPHLIELYPWLAASPNNLIAEAQRLFQMQIDNATPAFYYAVRESFRRRDADLQKSAMFIYLNRHGFNGLCRYDQKGKYNVPYGKGTIKKGETEPANPYFPDAELRAFAQKLQGKPITLSAQDFTVTMDAEHTAFGDVVYADPPYVPLSATSNFTGYAGKGFGLEDQEKLVKCAQACQRRGIPVVIANHNCAITQELYKEATRIVELDVARSINRNGAGRKPAKELMAVYLP